MYIHIDHLPQLFSLGACLAHSRGTLSPQSFEQ